MKASYSNVNELYKPLGCKQAERIDMKKVMERIQIQMEQRTRKIVGEGYNDKNLVKAINCRVIPVAVCMMNVCNFTGKLIDQLDKGIKKILRENNMHGNERSDERLYLGRGLGARGLKDVYVERKVKVRCYMTFSSSV